MTTVDSPLSHVRHDRQNLLQVAVRRSRYGFAWVPLVPLVMGPLLLVGGLSLAEPQNESDEIPEAISPEAIAQTRSRVETSMGELAGLAEQVRDDDSTGGAEKGCVIDKHERGRDVLEVATDDLLVLQDANATAGQQRFALEKLGAAADQLQALVAQAHGCRGDDGPAPDATDNEKDETPTIPISDPTLGGATSPVPPAVDAGRPPTVASPVL